MKIVLLLALLSVSRCSTKVVGHPGQDVTLNCKYDVKTYGPLHVCWGRGDLPVRGCSEHLIYTDGYKVTERRSSRYQLLGRLNRGDVSLTIVNITEDDAGRYGCRVSIPGPFNDEKYHMDLSVERVTLTTTPTTSHTEASTWQTTAYETTGHLTSMDNTIPTSPISDIEDNEEPSGLIVVLVCVLFGSVVLVIALVIARRCLRIDKLVQQQVSTPVHFTSTSSTLHLHSRGSAVENIYEIDRSGDRGGDYEYCP